MRKLTPLWPQWLAAFQVSFLAQLIMMSFKWNTFLIETLPTHEFEVWIEWLRCWSQFIGIIFGTTITSMAGASITIYTCGFFCLLNAICLIFMNTGELIYVYIIGVDIAFGIFICASPIYMGEISNSKIRGKLISLVIQGALTGNYLGNLAGLYFGIRSFGTIIIILSVLFLVSFFRFPPTPYYLMSCGRAQQALNSIKWYDHETNGQNEIESLVTFFEANPIMPFKKTISKLCSLVNRKILLSFIIIITLQNLGGLFAFVFRIKSLFNNSELIIMDSHQMVTIIGAIPVIFGWMFFFMSSIFERANTIFFGCTTLSIATFVLGLGYHLLELEYNKQITLWVILIASLVHQITINFVYLPISFIMMSELFSPDIKNIAICLCNMLNSVSLLVTPKYFDFLAQNLTDKYIFYSFSIVTVILGIFYTFCIPETKGKSLEEIQTMLNHKNASIELVNLESDNPRR